MVGGSVEDACLGAVDEHAPEGELADDFVEGPFGDEEFFGDVAHAVEGGTEEGEEVAFELVAAGDAAEAGAGGDVVAAEEDADSADADEDAGDLGDVVADLEDEEGEDDNNHDGPEIDELGGENGCVCVGLQSASSLVSVLTSLAMTRGRIGGEEKRTAISQYREVVPLHIQKCQDEILPSILEQESPPLLEAIFVERERRIDEIQEHVIPKRLESWDRKGLGRQQRRKGISPCNAERKDLSAVP